MRLPFAGASVRKLRDQLTAELRSHGLSAATVDDARIVLSELLSNALRHARPLADHSVVAAWRLVEDGVLVSVTDGGSPTSPHVRHPAALSVGGRGLAIVEVLSRHWWVESDASGTTVSAEIALQ